jgi:hypothetical protein
MYMPPLVQRLFPKRRENILQPNRRRIQVRESKRYVLTSSLAAFAVVR